MISYKEKGFLKSGREIEQYTSLWMTESRQGLRRPFITWHDGDWTLDGRQFLPCEIFDETSH